MHDAERYIVECDECGHAIDVTDHHPTRLDLRDAIVTGLSAYYDGTLDGTVGIPAQGVSDRHPILSNPGTVEEAADRILAALDAAVPEPHDAYCRCGKEGHPYTCQCDECRAYPYHESR
jgi:hypothetical protein